MLKTTIPQALGKARKFRFNKKKPDMDISRGVSGNKIDDKDIHLSSSIKKISCKVGFLTFKAKLAFT